MPRFARPGPAFASTVIASLALLWLAASPAMAQAYPDHPLTMIVPFPPGGPTDAVARIVSERMKASLGQPIVVENVVGASGSIGVGRAARSAPDGYTLSFGTWSTHVVNGAVMALSYDTRADFAPVALVSDNPMVIVSTTAIPAGDLRELIAWLQVNPDKASSGAPGIATPPSLAAVFFQQATKTRFQLVQYRGTAAAMQDLLAGRIELMFDFLGNALPHIAAGTIRSYAVLAKHRLGAAPDIPTVDEAGLPGLYLSSWQAIWVPKGTPATIIATLNRAVQDALRDPAVRQRLRGIAQEIPPPEQQTPDALGERQDSDIAKWRPIIHAANIKTE
jgi:tripartite-type tricarboxylate transporter receptor subunit TctC